MLLIDDFFLWCRINHKRSGACCTLNPEFTLAFNSFLPTDITLIPGSIILMRDTPSCRLDRLKAFAGVIFYSSVDNAVLSMLNVTGTSEDIPELSCALRLLPFVKYYELLKCAIAMYITL